MRYDYSKHTSRAAAEAALEAYFAEGEVSPGERPEIEPRRTPSGFRYFVALSVNRG